MGRAAREELILGRLSGFPLCCIAYYILHRRYHDLFPPTKSEIVRYAKDADRHISHVQCPWHAFTEPWPDYVMCVRQEYCGAWFQVGGDECNLCGHEVREMPPKWGGV